MRQSWTDERLDDLNGKVDRIDVKVDRLEVKIDHIAGDVQVLRAETKAGFESLYRLMIQVGGAIVAALIGLIATLGGVAITQL